MVIEVKDVVMHAVRLVFFFSSRRRHTRFDCDWSSDVCSSDLDLVELRHPIEDAGELLLEASSLLFRDRDTGKMSDTVDGRAVDGHGLGSGASRDRKSVV